MKSEFRGASKSSKRALLKQNATMAKIATVMAIMIMTLFKSSMCSNSDFPLSSIFCSAVATREDHLVLAS